MISTAYNDDIDLSYRIGLDYADVLGPYRISMIDEVTHHSIGAQAHNSFIVGVTGAMRWPVQFRPEVLIDGTGRCI